MINNIEENINGVNICIDSKVELIGILITLSDEPNTEQFKRLFQFNNSEYINNIKDNFSYLYDTGLIDRFNNIKNKYYLYYQEPIKLMLMLDNFNTDKLEEYFGYKPDNDIYNFINELKNLYYSDSYIKYYSNNKDIYYEYINGLKPFYSKYNISNIISNYCGKNNLELYNILIPFETNGGYGINIDNKAYYCSRINSNLSFIPEDIDSRLNITIHEFLHSIVNPLTDKKYLNTNYLSNNDNLKKVGYENDYTIINETIVRALTIRIYSLLVNDINSDDLIENEYNQGFIYIKEVNEILLENEKSNLNFEILYNRIIDIFK